MSDDSLLLEATDLRLRLRTHAGAVDAVRGVSFRLRRGETLGAIDGTATGRGSISETSPH
jgi:ABC-type dipeptide/oligopeptide/nickel transport system ATPase component